MAKVLITTVPFGEKDRSPLDRLEECGIEYSINPLNRKLTENELGELICDFDAVIAGTEPITENVMVRAPKLKHISRVGIGLDSVDLLAAERLGIHVSYTPDAPAPAVADLTIGLMINLLRSVHIANGRMHAGRWHRFFGRRIGEVLIGIIGVGRIGRRVIRRLRGFGPSCILANDLKPDHRLDTDSDVQWVDKETIYRNADVISLHLPLTATTKHLIRSKELMNMKSDALLINTSRGGIVNESDLFDVLSDGHLGGVAIDVFEQEPYAGPLANIERCLLTSHMGSMAIDCRTRMEIEATEETIRFVSGHRLMGRVPDEEYDIQRQGLGKI